jgi:hypothetical protein
LLIRERLFYWGLASQAWSSELILRLLVNQKTGYKKAKWILSRYWLARIGGERYQWTLDREDASFRLKLFRITAGKNRKGELFG